MGFFKYQARNVGEKRIVRDIIEAENVKDAMAKLRETGLVVLTIEQTFTRPGEKPIRPKKKIADRIREFFFGMEIKIR